MLLRHLKAQIAEIQNERPAQVYGALLGLTHMFMAIFMWADRFYLAAGKGRLCWPFLSSCRDWTLLNEASVGPVLILYGILAAATFLIFFNGRYAKWAYALLAFLFLAKQVLIFQDYRLMGNYHYMPSVLTALYLLVPRKITTGSLFLVFFYLSAGLLKLNPQWLSGQTLPLPPGLRPDIFAAMCIYVVILELVLVFGLWSRSPIVRWICLAQFVLFHLCSYYWVGYFYPAVMLTLLPVFPLAWRSPHWPAQDLKKAGKFIAVASLIYWAAQIQPWLLGGDSAVHGQGRMLSLNMFDANTICWDSSMARFKNRTVETEYSMYLLPVRIHCDPIVYLDEARRQCQILQQDSEFLGLDIELFSRRAVDPTYTHLISVQNFCDKHSTKDMQYHLFGSSNWLEGKNHENLEQISLTRPQNFPTANGPARFTYREDNAGTGRHTPSYLRLPLRQAWITPEINVGIHDASKSSPAVDESGVYVGADTGWFYAFDLDGKLRWSRLTRAVRGIHGTALLDAEQVVFGSYNGEIYSLRKADGALSWLRALADAVGSSPTFYKESVLVSSETVWPFDGYLARLNRKDGQLIWKSEWMNEQVHSSPVIDESTSLAFFGANNGRLAAIDLESGKTKWRFEAGGAIKGTPAVDEGRLYVTSWNKDVIALKTSDGSVLWKTPLRGVSQSSPTLIPEINRLVVLSHAESWIYGLELNTGRVAWSFPLAGSPISMGSGVAFRQASGAPWSVLIPCHAKTLCALDPRDGRVLQNITLPEDCDGVPAIHNGAVYVSLKKGGVVKLTDANQKN